MDKVTEGKVGWERTKGRTERRKWSQLHKGMDMLMLLCIKGVLLAYCRLSIQFYKIPFPVCTPDLDNLMTLYQIQSTFEF